MRKRIISMLLCLAVLFSMALPVWAEKEEEAEQVREPDLRISDVKEFMAFAESCRLDSYSRDLYVVLEADIDLDGTEFDSIPIFCGSFDGQSHTISGLELTGDGSAQGLFRYVTDTAQVQNLSVEGRIHPGGSRNQVGGIAGQNAGSITNCAFEGSVSGSDCVGGIAGSNTVTGIVDGCTVGGEISGEHFVGGLAGENQGVIRSCVNRAAVNVTARQNTVQIADINMQTLTNSEAANTTTDIGGIAGNSTGVIRACVNYADVGYKHMGYNVGGIAGTQSGYVVQCENYGFIQGRKEVGGIIGQMEPASVIEYTEDTLQILKGQLSTMTGLVNRASSNAQSNAGSIGSHLGVLQDQTQAARDAVGALIPDMDDPQLPDQDAFLAAQNTLSNTLGSMSGTVRGIANATRNTVSGLTRDLQAVANQVGAMSRTIGEAEENVGGSITDVSDLDTAEDLSGKVEGTVNHGDVLGDLNIGGIVGAMATENDLDLLEDWEQYGEESLNFESEIRAVVLNCENRGVVNCQKQFAGGIAGWQSMGLVKNSVNTGTLNAEAAKYVGGISGQSLGFLRGCSAKCEIRAASVAGGIAGSAAIATDCLSMVKLVDVTEQTGAILGTREENTTDVEDPIANNFYLSVTEDVGAIDGISYEGLGQPLTNNYFLVQKSLSDIFKSVQIRFIYEDGTMHKVTVSTGGRLNEDQIPQVPPKEGYTAYWEGLADAELTDILFDMEFHAAYTPYRTTLASEAQTAAELPLVLLEGSFTEEAAVAVEFGGNVPSLAEGEVLLESYTITAVEAGHTARLWHDADAEKLKLLVNGEPTEYRVDGSYLAFSMTETEAVVMLVQTPARIPWYGYAIVGAAAVLVIGVTVAVCRAAKKKKEASAEQEQA